MASNRDIEKLADSCLEKAGQLKAVPVDVTKIIEDAGLLIVRRKEADEDRAGISLSYKTHENKVNAPFLSVPFDVQTSLLRFAAVHAVGHILLHPGVKFTNQKNSYSMAATGFQDREATLFAMCVLMPAASIKNMAYGSNMMTTEMARRFSISPAAISERLRQMKLI